MDNSYGLFEFMKRFVLFGCGLQQDRLRRRWFVIFVSLVTG